MMETMETSRSGWFPRNSAAAMLPRKNQINMSVSKITEAVLSQLHDISRNVAHIFSILPKSEGFSHAQFGSLRGRKGHNLGFGLPPIQHGDCFSALDGLQHIFGA